MSSAILGLLMWLRNQCQKTHQNFLNLTPCKRHNLIVGMVDFLLRLVGVEVLNDCTRNWRTPLVAVGAAQYQVLLFYTAWYYWADNKITSFQPISVLPIAVPSIALYVQAIGWNRYRYRAFARFSTDYIYMDRVPSTEYEQRIDEHSVKLIHRAIGTSLLIFFSLSLMIIGPLYAYVDDGTYALPTGVILPFNDPESERGFAINITIQLVVAFLVLVGILGIETGTCFINYTFLVMADMVCFNMRKFSDGLRHGTFSYQQKMELRNILVQLQDVERFSEEWNDLYYWRFFLQPVMTTICVSIAIFAQMENDFKSGYGIALCLYIQLLIMCDMGNGTKVACEEIAMELYDMKWYVMPSASGKQVQAALYRWQKGCALTVGPFEELNYETASNMTRKIYSILMLFINYRQ